MADPWLWLCGPGGLWNLPHPISLASLFTAAFFLPCSLLLFSLLYSVISLADLSSGMCQFWCSPLYFLPSKGFCRHPVVPVQFLSLLNSASPLPQSCLLSQELCELQQQEVVGEDQPGRCQLFAQGGVGHSLGPWARPECGLGRSALLRPVLPTLSAFSLLPPLLPHNGSGKAAQHLIRPLQMLLRGMPVLFQPPG